MAKSTSRAKPSYATRAVPAAGGHGSKRASGPKALAAKPDGRDGRGRPRGVAPWSTRHAAKRAAEVARRNESPPPPGSARATLRVPAQADELKARLTQLSNATTRLKHLKKTLQRDFWDVSVLLGTVSEMRLYEAKGYASFEAYSERELDLGKATCQRLLQLARVFQESAARQAGLAPLLAALDLLEGEREPRPGLASTSAAGKPLKPPAMARS